MIKSINTWKKIIVYGMTTFLIFSISLTLMVAYNFYVQTLNMKNNQTNNYKNQTLSGMPCNDSNDSHVKLIERIDQMKVGYKVGNEKDPHIFLIDVIKIEGCKYIMVHNHIEGDTDLALIHAENCTNCKGKK